MMTKKEKLFTIITNSIALALFLSIIIPFGKNSITNFELIYKFLIAPIIACLVFLLNAYIKYVAGTTAYKYTSFSCYLAPIFYLVGLFAYAALSMLRSGAGSVYEISSWIILTFAFILVACLLIIAFIFIGRFVIFMKTKENVFLDLGIFVLVIAVTAVLKAILNKHLAVTLNDNILQFIVIPAIIGLAIVAFLVFLMLNYLTYNEKFIYASRKELLAKWNEGREEVYRQAEVDILYNLYDFSREELGLKDINVDEETEIEEEIPVEEELIVEEEPIVEEVDSVEEVKAVEEVEAVEEAAPAVEETAAAQEPVVSEPITIVQELDPSLIENVDNKLNELIKLKEELTTVEEEAVVEEIKSILPPKDFKPSFADMVKYAKRLKDVTFQGNEEGTNYKFFVNKKLFLILNDTPKDYRLTFLMDLPEASEYAQILAFSKAKSPKSIYAFKLVSKGEFDEATIKGIIKGSYNMLETIKQREIEAKEAEKARKAEEKLQAKLAEMSEEERVKYLARLEKKRALEAMTPEEREAKAQQEAKEKEEARLAKIAAQQAKAEEREQTRQERLAELQAKAKAKEEARLALEQAKAEEKERLAKEKEEARLALEKAKAEEKERLAKEKEQAKLALEKQKEKEKLAAQKAKEKEKLAAQKAKEKEQAKLALEKQKEKEKLAAQKAKEKEKLAAQKAKEKEKLAAQKAKEKEKLAAQKAKEKEQAQKANSEEKAA